MFNLTLLSNYILQTMKNHSTIVELLQNIKRVRVQSQTFVQQSSQVALASFKVAATNSNVTDFPIYSILIIGNLFTP